MKNTLALKRRNVTFIILILIAFLIINKIGDAIIYFVRANIHQHMQSTSAPASGKSTLHMTLVPSFMPMPTMPVTMGGVIRPVVRYLQGSAD